MKLYVKKYNHNNIINKFIIRIAAMKKYFNLNRNKFKDNNKWNHKI